MTALDLYPYTVPFLHLRHPVDKILAEKEYAVSLLLLTGRKDRHQERPLLAFLLVVNLSLVKYPQNDAERDVDERFQSVHWLQADFPNSFPTLLELFLDLLQRRIRCLRPSCKQVRPESTRIISVTELEDVGFGESKNDG